MESSTLSWYWRIVSSSWRFIPPFTFRSCSYLWKSLLPFNNNYWLFLIYCAWCIVVYWCNSCTIVRFSLDIIEWFKYKLKKVLKCTWYWFTPLSVSTVITHNTIKTYPFTPITIYLTPINYKLASLTTATNNP
jgi:hypothetical protein